MGTNCPDCGGEYERLGQHWNHNSSHRPELTQNHKEAITGLLMGDGWINRSSKNPYIQCKMISPNYLEYLDDMFGCLSAGVRLKETAEESAQNDRDSGFSSNAKVENYSDVYEWSTRTHPELQQFADWYSSGEKVWPADIELMPTVLRHWYCGDGSMKTVWTSQYMRITMSNEVDNTDKVDKYFKRADLPTPSNYNIIERDGGCIDCTAQWTKGDSKELWNYMGKPLPDFEYKWPEA